MDLKDVRKRPLNLDNPDIISAGITWVDGRIIVNPTKPQSMLYYGICHYSCGIWAVTPLDFRKPLMITSIMIVPLTEYSRPFCEKGHACLNFGCPLNRFDAKAFASEFKDCGLFSLGLPRSILEKKEQWFNTPKMIAFWKDMRIITKEKSPDSEMIIDVGVAETKEHGPEGGVLKFDKNRFEKSQ